MQLKTLLNEDDAVSPVIGVILMVAITVILAAVIATFVLGLGEQVSDTAPQASFDFSLDQDPETDDQDSWEKDRPSDASLLTIQHTGGPNVDASLLGVAGSEYDEFDGDDDPEYTDFSTATGESWTGDSMTAGDRVSIWIDDGDSISVTWTSEDGSSSATLQTFDGPES